MVCANESHDAQECDASTSQDVVNDNNETETTEREETTHAVDASGDRDENQTQDSREEQDANRESRDENEESQNAIEGSSLTNGEDTEITEESHTRNGVSQDANEDANEDSSEVSGVNETDAGSGEVEGIDGEESLELPETVDALTFDENHFSTPTGGASPVTSPRSRRRTTSSMDDSEVRRDAKCKYCVHTAWFSKHINCKMNVVPSEIMGKSILIFIFRVASFGLFVYEDTLCDVYCPCFVTNLSFRPYHTST